MRLGGKQGCNKLLIQYVIVLIIELWKGMFGLSRTFLQPRYE